MKKHHFAALFLSGFVAASTLTAENFNVYPFETPESLQTWSTTAGGKISLSDRHHLGGKMSLRWDFQPGGTLTLRTEPWYLNDPEASRVLGAAGKTILQLSVYSEQVHLGKTMRVAFGRNGVAEDDCWFDFHLIFSGWRHMWVVYNKDMQGTPRPDMNEIRFRAPADLAGSLYLDDLIPATFFQDRYQEGDLVVPFVKPSHAANPLALNALQPDRTAPLTEAEKAGFTLTAERMMEYCVPAKVRNKYSSLEEHARARYQVNKTIRSFRIVRHKDGRITGRPIQYGTLRARYRFVPDGEKHLSDYIALRSVGAAMQTIAQLYTCTADEMIRKHLENQYILLLDYLWDQGLDHGTCMGSRALLGYGTRELYNSALPMREVLRRTGRLERLFKTGVWQQSLAACLDRQFFRHLDADYLNTESRGALATLLLMEDSPEKAQWLEAFSQYLNEGLKTSRGWNPFVKPDGCTYHHWGHYPSYSFGGLQGAAGLLFVLKGSPWELGAEQESALIKAIAATRLQGIPFYPMALEGRVPFRKLNNTGNLALLPQLASVGCKDAVAALNDTELHGHYSFNYGGFGVHHYNGAMVLFKCFNRYIWGSEIYHNCNRFGRYLSYGTLFPMVQGTLESQGIVQPGWDWNRIPGATALRRSLETLELPSRTNTMITMPENRINGSSHFRNRFGIFGAITTEPDRKYFDPSFRSVKSYFAFGDLIIALGSNITAGEDNPVETTLFQHGIGDGSRPGTFGNTALRTGLGVEERAAAPVFMTDFLNRAWFVLQGNVVYRRQQQTSPDQSNTKTGTGNFATAVIEHGTKPQNASYEYALRLHCTPEDAEKYMKLLQTAKPYQVLRCDDTVHMIRYKPEKMLCFVAFRAAEINEGVFLSVDRGAYVMAQKSGDVLEISLNTPDLADFLPRSKNDLTTTGGFGNETEDRKITLSLKGTWTLMDCEGRYTLKTQNGNTLLTMPFRDGMVRHIRLRQQ